MSDEPFLGEIRIVSFNFPPRGWAFCNGQFLPINQNQPLFSLLGTMYGGNGQTTFALPNLQGRVPLHFGSGFNQGTQLGTDAHTISSAEMPIHLHQWNALLEDGDSTAPAGRHFAKSLNNLYAAPSAFVAMAPETITNVGGSQAHENRQPYIKLNFCIALQGIFPARN